MPGLFWAPHVSSVPKAGTGSCPPEATFSWWARQGALSARDNGWRWGGETGTLAGRVLFSPGGLSRPPEKRTHAPGRGAADTMVLRSLPAQPLGGYLVSVECPVSPASHSPAPTPHLLCAEGVKPGLWQSCDLRRVSVSEPADGLTPAPFAIQCVIWSTHVVIPAAASSGVTVVKGKGTRPGVRPCGVGPITPSHSA